MMNEEIIGGLFSELLLSLPLQGHVKLPEKKEAEEWGWEDA